MSFRQPLTRSADWIKRRLASNSNAPTCASPLCTALTCTALKTRWRRFRRDPKIFLDGKSYCQTQCLELALAAELSRLLTMNPPLPPPNRIPLGLLMVARGKLTHAEVRAALDAQSRAQTRAQSSNQSNDGRVVKIGDWFEKLGFATEQDVTAALALQWGCPVVSSLDRTVVNSPGSIPLSILEAVQMLPVNYAAATSTLYLAFGERVDHAAVYAVERTLNCRTQPCVGRRKSIARQLESMRHSGHSNDVEFVSRDLNEMVRIAMSYVSRLNPDEIRASRVGRFIWLRLAAQSSGPHSPATNLVFCVRANALPAYSPLFESRPVPWSFPTLSDSQPNAHDDDNAIAIEG